MLGGGGVHAGKLDNSALTAQLTHTQPSSGEFSLSSIFPSFPGWCATLAENIMYFTQCLSFSGTKQYKATMISQKTCADFLSQVCSSTSCPWELEKKPLFYQGGSSPYDTSWNIVCVQEMFEQKMSHLIRWCLSKSHCPPQGSLDRRSWLFSLNWRWMPCILPAVVVYAGFLPCLSSCPVLITPRPMLKFFPQTFNVTCLL